MKPVLFFSILFLSTAFCFGDEIPSDYRPATRGLIYKKNHLYISMFSKDRISGRLNMKLVSGKVKGPIALSSDNGFSCLVRLRVADIGWVSGRFTRTVVRKPFNYPNGPDGLYNIFIHETFIGRATSSSILVANKKGKHFSFSGDLLISPDLF